MTGEAIIHRMASAGPAPRSILDESATRYPIVGSIRTGIKVLTRAASNPESIRMFEAGVAAGKKYDQIEKELIAKFKFERSPLTPKNVPWFRLSRADFDIPEIADRLLELYGEDRGEGRHLYRLPIILPPFDDLNEVLPHGLQSYGANGLKYWSEYDGAGQRFCMTHKAADVDPRNQRAARAWGGRKIEVRRDMPDGICDPENCREYQSKKCSFTGRLLFWVPGVPGTGLIRVNTGSIYGLKQMKATLEMVARVRGRVSGVQVYPGGTKPIFWLCKVEDEVTRLDEKGLPVPTTQYLTKLEADLSMDAVFAQLETRGMVAITAAPTTTVIEATAEAAPPPDHHQPEDAQQAQEPDDVVATLLLQVGAELTRIYGDDSGAKRVRQIELTNLLGSGWAKDADKLRQALESLKEIPF